MPFIKQRKVNKRITDERSDYPNAYIKEGHAKDGAKIVAKTGNAFVCAAYDQSIVWKTLMEKVIKPVYQSKTRQEPQVESQDFINH